MMNQSPMYPPMVMQQYHQYSTTPRQNSSQWNHQNQPVSFTQIAPVFAPVYQYAAMQQTRPMTATNLPNPSQTSINMQSNILNNQNVQQSTGNTGIIGNNTTLNNANVITHLSTHHPRKRREFALPILDPQSGKDVLEEVLGDTSSCLVSYLQLK